MSERSQTAPTRAADDAGERAGVDDVERAERAGGVSAGRLGFYAALGASTSAVPLPLVPDALARRIRGALLHDVAVRHGVSLSPEARGILSEPLAPGVSRGVLARAARYAFGTFAVRTAARVAPVGALFPLGGGVRTYVLGHLFDRYLAQRRTARAVRIDAEEARRIRAAIDGAFLRALASDAEPPPDPEVVDDQRDAVTAFFDGVLGAAAGLPERLSRKLDAAFDEGLNDARG